MMAEIDSLMKRLRIEGDTLYARAALLREATDCIEWLTAYSDRLTAGNAEITAELESLREKLGSE